MREEIAADLNSFNTAIYTWNWNDAGNQIIIDNHPANTFDAWRAYTINTDEVNSSNEDNN